MSDGSTRLTAAQNFLSLVEKTYDDLNKLNSGNLIFHKKLGSRVAKLLDAPDKYGNRTVEMFCEDLNKRNPEYSLSPSSVYTCVRVWKGIGDEGFDKAIATGVSWRNLRWLGSKSIDDNTRSEVLDNIVSGKVSQLDAREEVDRIKAGGEATPSEEDDTPDVAQTKKATKHVHNLPSLFEKVQEKVAGYADSAHCIVNANQEPLIAQAIKDLDTFRTNYEAMVTAIDHEYEKATRALSKFR